MTEADWTHAANHALGMWFDGGEPMLLLLNGGGRNREFALPPPAAGRWHVAVDTAHAAVGEVDTAVTLAPHSLVLLRQR